MSRPAPYLWTLAAVVAATVVRALLDPFLGDAIPYATYFIAIAFGAWLGGVRTGALATIMGGAVASYFFVPPRHAVILPPGPDLLGLVVYLVAGGLISTLGEQIQKAQRRVDLQRKLLHVTLDSIGDAVISTDTEGKVVFLNPVAERLTGWSLKEAEGKPLVEVFRIVNETTRETVDNPALRALREGAIVGLANHTILIARDGAEHPIDDSAAPIRDPEGVVSGAVLVFRDVGATRRAQQAESTLAAIVQSSGDAIVSKTLDGIIRSWNDGAERIFGHTAAEAIGESVNLIIPTHLREEEQEIIARLRRGERVEHFETQRMAKDGRLLDISLTISPICNEEGEVIGASKVARDVTARRSLERAKRESDERFRGLMEQAPLSIQIFSPDGQTVSVNRAWEELWGIDRQTILQYNILRDAQLEEKGIAPLLRRAFDGEPVQLPAIQYDPEETVPGFSQHPEAKRWVSAVAYPLYSEDGRVREVVLVHQDVSAEMRSIEALKESEERLRLALDAGKMGVWDWNVHTNELRWTENLGPIHGIPPDEFGGTFDAFMDLVHLEDRGTLQATIGTALAECGSFYVEFRNPWRDGTLHWVAGVGEVMCDAEGKPERMIGVGMNIDQRKQAEEALLEADRRKDEFLATLAHELRNPLAPIRNAVQIMSLRTANDPALARSQNVIERQVQHMVRLIDDLLDVGRITSGKLELQREHVELKDAIDQALEAARPFLERAGHRLTLQMPEKPVNLYADPVRLAQIFANLLTNAAKYTDAGGEITVSAETQDGEVVVRVRDTGVGIEAEDLPRLFEMFSQVSPSHDRSDGGLGIGLALIKGLVTMHGGSVTADSEGPARGSVFTVRLPVDTSSHSEPSGKGDNGNRTAPASRLILVVDDNLDNAESLAELLRIYGSDVETAHDGVAALEAAERMRPDVILLDLGMPKLDGYEVCRRLREHTWAKRTTIIAQTGWGGERDREKTAAAGFDAHLVKPVDPDQLLELLAKVPRREEPAR